jgi:FkbM family methyltransferase
MRTSRRKLEELAWVFGLHGSAVRLHRALGKRADVVALTRFYAELLPKGALAFDIGANVGLYSEALEAAGAHVIAVEPNADCCRHIELTYQSRKIEMVHAAAGPRNGLSNLILSDIHDDASTISEQARNNGHLSGARTVAIPTVTLDCLISHYGMPYYVKMDVEGYESAVLDGLSTQPHLLSFEFHHLYAERALSCLDKPLFRTATSFNVSDENGTGLELQTWVSKEEIRSVADRIAGQKTYRDIYVRKDGSR